MANINSLTSSNSYSSTSSIYGNRNVLTGLASGMDTEAMIQNSVTGYQTKISQLQQSQTKLEWKQDAYRELIDQMYNISQKYTSYTSKTNLSSNTFFTSNVTTTANGANAAAVSASGTAKSDIQINAVTKLATAARYAVDAKSLGVNAVNEAIGDAIDWGGDVTKGTLSGTMTLRLGSNTVDLKFTEDDQYETLDDLVKGINDKLADISVNSKKLGSIKAGDVITASLGEDGEIKFSSNSVDGDSAYISGASGNLKTMLNVKTATSTADKNRFDYTSFSLKGEESDLVKTSSKAEYLSGKSIDVTLDGVTKSIKIGDLTGKTVTFTGTDDDGNEVAKTKKVGDLTAGEAKQAAEQISKLLRDDIQASIDKEFGKNRVTVGLTDPKTLFQDNGAVSIESRGLTFDVAKDSGSTLKVTSSVGEELGIGDAGVSNYFNTSQKLGSLLDADTLNSSRIAGERDESAGMRYFDKDGNELKLEDGVYYRMTGSGAIMTKNGEKVTGKVANAFDVDVDGNLIQKNYDEDTYYRVNEKGDYIYGLEINGTTVEGFTKDTALESVLNKINSNTDVGVTVSYSNLTSQFVFTARETGAGGDITFDNPLAKALFKAPDANAPTSKTVGDILGNMLEWDEDGNASLMLKTPGDLIRLGPVNKDDSFQSLLDKFASAGSAYADLIHYDAATDTYSLQNGSGGAMSEAASLQFAIRVEGQASARMDFAEVLESANSMAGFTAGTDAEVQATVNGKELTLKRSTNVIEMDGLSVTLKHTFNEDGTGEAVTFTTSSNADAVVDAIKSFVEDVNKLMTSVHDAYTTQPVAKTSSSSSSGTTYYEPLTEDDKNSMSESAVEKYEEKAKTGLLFGDNDLRTLYDKLLTSIQSYGADRITMESIGLSTTYSGGVTTIALNEAKLREALDSDPDKVKNVFTKTRESGSSTDGLMATLKSTLNAYGSTSIASPGVLVNKAGTKLSAVSLLNNNLAKQISNLDKQIESWQSKLSNKIDYYTKQFTALEQLMSTMNNQSSMLADLMGGY